MVEGRSVMTCQRANFCECHCWWFRNPANHPTLGYLPYQLVSWISCINRMALGLSEVLKCYTTTPEKKMQWKKKTFEHPRIFQFGWCLQKGRCFLVPQTGRSRDAFPWLSDVRFGSGGYVYTVDSSETPSMGLVYLPTWMIDLYGKCR